MVRVLVVDDEPDVLLLCRVNLRHDGFEVIEAPDGISALEMAREGSPDVIVLDLMLPTVDGFQVLAELAEGDATGDIPVAILSAKAQIDDRLTALRGGAIAYLTKPFSPERLVEVVRELADSSNARRASLRANNLLALEAERKVVDS